MTQPVDSTQRARRRARAVARAAATPIETQPLVDESPRRRGGNGRPQRLLGVLLLSLVFHGGVISLRLIQGIDPDQVAQLTSRGPMHIRTLRRDARAKERAAERAAKEREAEERARAEDEVRPERPAPRRQVVVEEPAEAEGEGGATGDGEGEPSGGAAGPLFSGAPVGSGGGSGGGGAGYRLGSGDGSGKPRTEGKKGEAPPPKEKPKKRRIERIDPNEPIEMTREIKAPKPHPRNRPPRYPEPVRRRGITGLVVVKLHVHNDGTVRAIRIIRAENSATVERDQKKAAELLKKAVVSAVAHWRYEPAEYKGQKISVWVRARFPFKLAQ